MNETYRHNYALDSILACSPDVGGWTPLHCAAAMGSQRSVDELLRSDYVNPESRDLRDWTPLHYACLGGHVSVVASLIRRSSAIKQGIDGITALHCAADSGNGEVAKLIVDRLDLIQDGGKVRELRDRLGRAAIHRAILAGSVEVVGVLKHDAGLDIESEWGALHLAVARQQFRIVEKLLEGRIFAELGEHTDEDGLTPLLLAAQRGYWQIAQLLLIAGANINATDGNGSTFLHFAANEGGITEMIDNSELREAVLNSQPRFDARDNSGFTARDLLGNWTDSEETVPFLDSLVDGSYERCNSG